METSNFVRDSWYYQGKEISMMPGEVWKKEKYHPERCNDDTVLPHETMRYAVIPLIVSNLLPVQYKSAVGFCCVGWTYHKMTFLTQL
jgi:hypothetical protein